MTKMSIELKQFIDDFDIVENALDMRNLIRWNGRDLRYRENLSEHTHLVVACAIKLYDELKKEKLCIKGNTFELWELVSIEDVIKRCMLHDSLELLRGDILSITKDAIPGLRALVDEEEDLFIGRIVCANNHIEIELVELADLMACYKFVERELKYPANNFAKEVYKSTKAKFDLKYSNFLCEYGIADNCKSIYDGPRVVKGYAADAGADIILDEDVTIMPLSTTMINLNIKVTPLPGSMGFLCARTSAAAKGLCVAMCPIDADYTGDVTAIVHNVSNEIITYKKGEAFCQLLLVDVNDIVPDKVKKPGTRSDGKLGSTDK